MKKTHVVLNRQTKFWLRLFVHGCSEPLHARLERPARASNSTRNGSTTSNSIKSATCSLRFMASSHARASTLRARITGALVGEVR